MENGEFVDKRQLYDSARSGISFAFLSFFRDYISINAESPKKNCNPRVRKNPEPRNFKTLNDLLISS